MEGLNQVLLRSSTPAPNEKVLNYLESMSREGDEPSITPPRSLVDGYHSRSGSVRNGNGALYSPPPGSQKSAPRLELPSSPMSYANRHINGAPSPREEDGDVASDVQEGRRSEVGDNLLLREPGPHDPPGPKYESYDSGPSFGNFGPLPPDDHVQPAYMSASLAHGSWNPSWSQKPAAQSAWNGNGANIMTPGNAAGVPLPASEYAKSPKLSAIGTDMGGSRPLQFQKPPSERDEPTSPKSNRTVTQNGNADRDKGKSPADRPWSPRSQMTARTKDGTAYPPLPESRMGDNDQQAAPMSPMSRTMARSHRAQSISPSESPSQARGSRRNTGTSNNNGAGRSYSQSQGPGSVMSGGHQSRPFSPYRHAPTTEDLVHAAARGRSLAIPEEDEHDKSATHSKTHSKAPSQISKAPSYSPSQLMSPGKDRDRDIGGDSTPRARSPNALALHNAAAQDRSLDMNEQELNQEEAQIVADALAGRTPRTSYYAGSGTLEEGVANHFHDMELCVLLHQENDPNAHEFVKKALRKAVRQRVKRLGMKYDNESIRQYKKSHHDHDPSVHLRSGYLPADQDPPKWASDIKRELVIMQQRIESLGPKIENLMPTGGRSFNDSRFNYDGGDEYTAHSPTTQTVNIQTQPTGTAADSMFQPPQSELVIREEDEEEDSGKDRERGFTDGGGAIRSPTLGRSHLHGLSEERDDSPGQQFLEEELYKLRQKPRDGSQSGVSHRTWEVTRNDEHARGDERESEVEYEGDADADVAGASGLPTIPDSNGGAYNGRDGQTPSPPLPALPHDHDHDSEGHPGEMVTTAQGPWNAVDYGADAQQQLPPWQRIHARLLSWAIIWPASELDHALNSTTRGNQVDEVALSIWSTQTYKRYVRARLTDTPAGVVDRLFVPPNMADAISNAVFNGRHGDACGMLRDLWSPFGIPGMPRLLVVLAKHRSDANHWVVHRFSLPDGALTTYDSYPERTLPDGRPLGWWFAIRVAWPNAIYPSPDHLMQKMVRLHRPLQLAIDNSVAAAGIWRNILMGSRAERSLDLERLRDLINTEVKNLRQRKQMGKLSIGAPRPTWEDMN